MDLQCPYPYGRSWEYCCGIFISTEDEKYTKNYEKQGIILMNQEENNKEDLKISQ